jgi:PelA/Pel-15E family pectate lyase
MPVDRRRPTRAVPVTLLLTLLVFPAVAGVARRPHSGPADPSRRAVLDAMRRATAFMMDKVSCRGGFVWSYLPDLSRRWGELEARETMIWIQPPGTPSMGHLLLDAFHATGDEYYYAAAVRVTDAVLYAQLPSGGWNYLADYAGDRSLQAWYDTIGRNAWRLEEFQHNWGNATFDDGGTASAARLLLRMFLEKHEPRFKQSLDKAIQFVLDSQYPIGAWPQRFPLENEFSHHGHPDYTSYLTFNDDVTAGNVDVLIQCYQALGDRRLLGPIQRGMKSFVAAQQAGPQPGWALQYTTDLKPAGARTYEPPALATHTTAGCIEQLMRFYRLTGDAAFLARIPEALDWLDAVRLAPDLAARTGRSHPTFIAIGTNRPIFIHRRGSNVVNGTYYADEDPTNTIGHYSSFRQVDVAGMRRQLAALKTQPVAALTAGSPLAGGAVPAPLPRYMEVHPIPDPRPGGAESTRSDQRAAEAVAELDDQGRWIGPLWTTSHPYKGDGSARVAPGDFSRSNVGDDTDTSPFHADGLKGLSTQTYIRHMSDLIRYLDSLR